MLFFFIKYVHCTRIVYINFCTSKYINKFDLQFAIGMDWIGLFCYLFVVCKLFGFCFCCCRRCFISTKCSLFCLLRFAFCECVMVEWNQNTFCLMVHTRKNMNHFYESRKLKHQNWQFMIKLVNAHVHQFSMRCANITLLFELLNKVKHYLFMEWKKKTNFNFAVSISLSFFLSRSLVCIFMFTVAFLLSHGWKTSNSVIACVAYQLFFVRMAAVPAPKPGHLGTHATTN